MRTLLRVGKNALARLSSQAGAKLFSLVTVALIARYEDAAGLGRYVLVLTVVGILQAVSDLGLNIFLTREVAHKTDLERHRDLLGVVLPLKSGLSVVGYAILLLVAAFAPFPESTQRLLPLGGLVLLPNAAMEAMAAVINGRQRMEVTGFLSIVVGFVALIGAFWALMTGRGVSGVLIWTVGTSLLGALLHSGVLWRWELLPRVHWNPTAWRASLVEAYPFALTAIIAMVYARLDLVLLSLWQGETIAGWYGAAYKLWQTVGLLPTSVLDAMFPELSRLAENRQSLERLGSLFRTSGRAMLVGGIALAAGGMAGAGALITLVYGYGDAYALAVPVFQLLAWAIPAMFLYLLGGHTLYALSKQRQVTVAMTVAGLTNVVLNVIVIPRWGGLGAGGVALFSEWLLFLMLYPQARRALKAGAWKKWERASMKPDLENTARAFDAVASDYDVVYGPSGNAVMTLLRQESLTLLRETFPVGSRLLEIGCGTGEEAVYLARKGYTILATDISPAMAAQAQAKAHAAGLTDQVTPLVLPAGHLDALRPARPLEGSYASFGALNCEPDLLFLRDALARLLQPGSAFVCSVMGRWCPFEIAWFMLHGRPREAFRRLRRGWQQVPVSGRNGAEVFVPTRYLSVREVARAFAPAFFVERTMALPLLLPPPYLDSLYRARRGLFDRIEPWDRRLRTRWPLRMMGDHVAIVLRKTDKQCMKKK